MIKRILKGTAIGLVLMFATIVIIAISSDTAKDSYERGKEAGQGSKPDKSDETEGFAVLSGEDETGDIIQNINVWQKAGSGGIDNVTIGNIPHGTKVEVIEKKNVDGKIFYHVRSSVGNVSVLPTTWEARGEAMEERPKSEWYVEADVSFPVEGWVIDSFITNLK